MKLEEFFDRVLPASGEKFFGATIDNNRSADKFAEARFDSKDALRNYIEQSSNKPSHDVYFATGTYSKNRKADECDYKKAFYLDVDCGDGKGYATKNEALGALQDFCKKSTVPFPSIIVDSGNGLHCYWTLTEEIHGAMWKMAAISLKNVCTAHGFKADPTSTADPARILRAPTSTNFKNLQHPKPCRVVHGIGTKDVPYATFAAALNIGPSKLTGNLGEWADDDDLAGGQNWRKGPHYSADVLVTQCEVFKHSIATGGASDTEPVWKGQLLVLAHAVNGEKYVHLISSKHPGYTHQLTEWKYKDQHGKVGTVGPTTCAEFGAHAPDLCAKCAWKGHVVGPLMTGSPVNEETPPEPFELQASKVIKNLPPVEGKPVPPLVVCHFGIKNFRVSQAYGEEVNVKFDVVIARSTKPVALTVSEATDKKTLVGALSHQGVVIQDSQFKEFRNLMTSWIAKMQDAKKEQVSYSHMGWVQNGKQVGFAVGHRILWPGGAETANSLNEEAVADQFTACGSIDEWLSISHEITAQNKPAINTIISTAFAAPLFHLVGQDGFFMSFSSAASGSGKTTALRIAQSVWGDPVRGISMLDDTPLSVVKRLGLLHNLPAYWDEVRIKNDPAAFVSLMFQLTLGKERSRLTSSTKMQTMGTWSTMLVIATNDSIVDHVSAETRSTDAGRARIFEVEVTELDKPDYELADRVAHLKSNFGHAGLQYARFLVDNAATVATQVRGMTAALTKRVQPRPAERFWVAGAAAIVVGAHYANKLGLTKIDVSTMTEWLKKQIFRQRESMRADFKTAPSSAVDFVWEYCAEFRDNFVVCHRLSGRGVSDIGSVYWRPERGRVLGTIAVHDKKVRIGRKHFTDWLYKRQVTPSQVIDTLLSSGQASESLARVAMGMENIVSERIRCIDVKRVDDDLIESMAGGVLENGHGAGTE